MSAKKEVVKKAAEELSLDVKEFIGFDEEQQTNEDILIPKILAMQGISQMVTDGEATFGDLRDSVTAEKLGDASNPVKIIPFFVHKCWVVSKRIEGRWEFFSRDPVTTDDKYRPYESILDGVETKNELCYDLYCFVEGRLDMPYVVSFKGASKRTGQKMTTHFKKLAQSKKLPFSYKLDLHSKKTKNDRGTYITFDVSVAGAAEREEMIEASKWFRMIKDGIAKINESDLNKKSTPIGDTEDQF